MKQIMDSPDIPEINTYCENCAYIEKANNSLINIIQIETKQGLENVKEIASAVEFDPVPAMTGFFPLLSFIHNSITFWCSSWLNVGDSPVVPAGTRAFVSFFI